MDKVLVKDLNKGIVDQEPLNFLNYCKKNRRLVSRNIAHIAARIPTEMYTNDNRMDIGKYTAFALALMFEEFIERLEIGYDLIFTTDKQAPRISVKFNKGNVFQRIGRDNKWTNPGNITIKNTYNSDKSRNSVEDFNFDYLWTISYDVSDSDMFSDGHVGVQFGVASKATVLEHIVKNSIGKSQIHVKIKNHEWDFYSESITVYTKVNHKLSNSVYVSSQNELWKKLVTL